MTQKAAEHRDSPQASPEQVKMDKLYAQYLEKLAVASKSTDKKEEQLMSILAGFEDNPVHLDPVSGKGTNFLIAQRKKLEGEQDDFDLARDNVEFGLTDDQKKNLLKIVQFPQKAYAFNKMTSFFEEFDLKGTGATPLAENAPASLLEAQARHNASYSEITRIFENSQNGISLSKEKWAEVTAKAKAFKSFDVPFQAHIKSVMRYDEQKEEYVLKNPASFERKTKKANEILLKATELDAVINAEQFQKMTQDITAPLPQIANLSEKSSSQKKVIEAYRVNVMNDLRDYKSSYDYQIFLINLNGETSLDAENKEHFRTATVRALMQRAQYEQYLKIPEDEKVGISWLSQVAYMGVAEGAEEIAEEMHDSKMRHISNARLMSSFSQLPPAMQQTVLQTLGTHLARDGVVFVEGLSALSETQLKSLLTTLNNKLPPEGRFTIGDKLNNTQMRRLAQRMLEVPRGNPKYIKEIADFSELSPEVRKQLLNAWKSIEKELIKNKVPPARIAEIRKNLKALQQKGFFKDMLEMARNPVTVMIFAIYVSEHPNNIQASLNWIGFIGISKGIGLATSKIPGIKKIPGIQNPYVQFFIVMASLWGGGKYLNKATTYLDERLEDSQAKEFFDGLIGGLEMPPRMIGDLGRAIGWNKNEEFMGLTEFLLREKTGGKRAPERVFYKGRKDWNNNLDEIIRMPGIKGKNEMIARFEADRINEDWGLRQNLDLVGKVATLKIYRNDFLIQYEKMKKKDDDLPFSVDQLSASLEAGEEAAIADTKDIGGEDRNDQYIARLLDGTPTLTGYSKEKQEALKSFHIAKMLMEGGSLLDNFSYYVAPALAASTTDGGIGIPQPVDDPKPSWYDAHGMAGPSEEILKEIASGKKNPTDLPDKARLRLLWNKYTGQMKHVSTMVSMYKHLTLPDSKGVERQMYNRHTWLGDGTPEENKVFGKRILDGQMSYILLMLKLEKLAPHRLNTKDAEALNRLGGGKTAKPDIPLEELDP
tara:strand:+ start:917 stop:3892 length:2976 start_codon:yes stop_codon:yes gene_type:complete